MPEEVWNPADKYYRRFAMEFPLCFYDGLAECERYLLHQQLLELQRQDGSVSPAAKYFLIEFRESSGGEVRCNSAARGLNKKQFFCFV